MSNSIMYSDIYPFIIDNVLAKGVEFDNTMNSNNVVDVNLRLIEYNKKDLGKFYTSEDKVLDALIDNLDVLQGKILEPSCGTGNILIRVILKIVKQLKIKQFSACEILDYICENVYGNDIDEIAIATAEMKILGVLERLIVEARKENNYFRMKRLKLSTKNFANKNEFAQFSVIIGNPPFVTMYGRRSRNMTEEKRNYYNTFDFVQNKKGNNKFNVAMFFIENGIKALKNDGKLIYILDISFFETAYIDIRKYIVERCFINRLVLGLNEFEGVASGQIILELTNKKEFNESIEILDFQKDKKNVVDQALWDNIDNNYKYYIPLNYLEEKINNKILKHLKLDNIFPNKSLRTCCALTGKTEEFIVNAEEDTNCLVFPYIEGSKGLKGKFFRPTPLRLLKYDYELQLKLSDEFKKELELKGVKNKKRVTLGDKEAYLSPKVFIRQSANEIIATYCEEAYAANNSIYILTNKIDTEENRNLLKYTCALLNSDLITFYCKINKIIRADIGKTPQIKVSDLKKIRINIDETYYKDIIKISDKLLEQPCDSSLLLELNDMVYNIYGISHEEKKYIQTKLNK